MPASTRPRALSVAEPPSKKKLKTSHDGGLAHYFADGVLDASDRLKDSYRASGPYLHAVIDKLFKNDLLAKARDECIGELSFTEKETDIYKVHQTGDLASLSYLAEAQIALLPNLLKLRDALYSQTFRDFLRKVTGCGPLSGKKQDMSVNSYKKGCHLLNHDDVIGSRCVSYILYLPMPETEGWRREWGGALELYPAKLGPDGVPEPECIPSKSIPPSWNQFIFFEVQPGRSFHSVEEVIVDEDDCKRQRLSISGWFHRAQEGEEGYEGETVDVDKSSLAQLTSTRTLYTPYPDIEEVLATNPFAPLSSEHISFLSAFLEPTYLQPQIIGQLSKQFVEESSIQLHKFLCAPLAAKLEAGLLARDKKDGLDGGSRQGRIPAHTSGIKEGSSWTLRGPPHKARYCSLSASSSSSAPTPMSDADALATVYSPNSTPEQLLYVLETTLFSHPAFRTWLALIAQLLPTKYVAQARRFRPGLDYTLATSNDEQSILDVALGLTPETEEEKTLKRKREEKKGARGKGKGRAPHQEDDEDEEEPVGWERGDWGGWECYMAPHEGEEDPAVYRSGSSKKKPDSEHAHGHAHAQNGTNGSVVSTHSSHDTPGANGNGDEDMSSESALDHSDDDDDDDDDNEEDEDDGTLLTVYPGFNRLMLALRDEGVLRFVKYVSASAPSSVWDVCGEYEVSMTEEDEEGGEANGAEKLKQNGT